MSVQLLKKRNAFLLMTLVSIGIVVTICALITERHKDLLSENYDHSIIERRLKQGNRHITNVEKTVDIEFISYEIIEDIEIRSRTEYPAYNYYLSELPDPKYTEAVTDWDSLRNEHPEFDEEQKRAAERGGEAATVFRKKYDPIVERFTTIIHPKTRYIFVNCVIKNIAEADGIECLLNEINVNICSSSSPLSADCSDCLCYFDKAIKTEGEDREHEFFLVKLDKDDRLECTLGFEIKERFGTGEQYYFYFEPMVTGEINPKYLDNSVCLNDVKTKNES